MHPLLLKRLEPQAGGFILRISAREAHELGLRALDEVEVQLWPHAREDLLRR